MNNLEDIIPRCAYYFGMYLKCASKLKLSLKIMNFWKPIANEAFNSGLHRQWQSYMNERNIWDVFFVCFYASFLLIHENNFSCWIPILGHPRRWMWMRISKFWHPQVRLRIYRCIIIEQEKISYNRRIHYFDYHIFVDRYIDSVLRPQFNKKIMKCINRCRTSETRVPAINRIGIADNIHRPFHDKDQSLSGFPACVIKRSTKLYVSD